MNKEKNYIKELAYFFVTGFYMGTLPKMPGTYASIFAMILGIEIIFHFSYATLVFLTYLFFLFGIKAIEKYEKENNIHDDPKTAIDEIIGMFFAITISYHYLDINNKYSLGIELVIITILFRYFDIIKPGIIGNIDKNVHGAIGTVLDDVVAGFYAAFIYVVFKSMFF